MRPAIDMTGQRFGRLTVVERAGSAGGQAVWRCLCDCGAIKAVTGGNLRNGGTLTCGCGRAERAAARRGRALVRRPSYIGAHTRVYSARGRAADYLCRCGARAEEWAYDHSDPEAITAPWRDQAGALRDVTYSGKPEHYIPMCKSCHLRFDKTKG